MSDPTRFTPEWLLLELDKLWAAKNVSFGSSNEREVEYFSAHRNGYHQAIRDVKNLCDDGVRAAIEDLLCETKTATASAIDARIREAYCR
jgi:hypothetical protein